MKHATLPTLSFESQQSWEDWLQANHASSKGIWLKIAKKETGIPSMHAVEARDVAFCYGWMDGPKVWFGDQRTGFEGYWLHQFLPRGPKSRWSKISCARAAALLSAGRMQPAGLQQVELAKADGRWKMAYDPQRQSAIPEDLQRALDRTPQAQAFFNTLDIDSRFHILYRIQTANQPKNRAALIKAFSDLLANHIKLYL